MKFKFLFITILLICFAKVGANATSRFQILDTIPAQTEILDTDSILNRLSKDTIVHFKLPVKVQTVKVDSLVLLGNPFFIELVYNGLPINYKRKATTDLKTLIYGQKVQLLKSESSDTNQSPEKIIADLRNEARSRITQENAKYYVMTFDQLPDANGVKSHIISKNPLTHINFLDEREEQNQSKNKILIRNTIASPWQYNATSMAQFSESAISDNWYQGGNSNLAVLGILTGQLTYDNKKNIQWDNNAEWRLGVNTVPGGDDLHWLSITDDVLRVNSKLGIKASGNFFYSGSVDFSTQFFQSYRGLTSTELKTAFMTPVRLNVGVGLDYKYKKMFSLMVSPVSYKYIYVSDSRVNPNLFGIKTGERKLSELGSSFKALVSYPLTDDIKLDSRLTFYTNYQKVEIDWEMVANLTINRFLSTRISFNPRYDNTVIMPDGQHADLQFKQLLSVGFSHKFH